MLQMRSPRVSIDARCHAGRGPNRRTAIWARMPSRRPARSVRSGQRTGGALRRAGEGGWQLSWRLLGARGFSGRCPIWRAIHGAVPTWKAQPCIAYSGSIAPPASPTSSRCVVPSHRSIRPAIRGAAVRCGGWGEGRARTLGSCSPTRRFRGAAPYGVLSTDLCPPGKPNGDCHTAGPITHLVSPHAPVPSLRAIRPAVRGPAVRAAACGGKGPRWRALGSCSLTRGFRVAAPIWRCDPRSCAHLERSILYAIQRVRHAPRVSAGTSRSLRSIRPADRGPAVRCGGLGEGGWGAERLGSCSLTRLFTGGTPYGVEPTEL